MALKNVLTLGIHTKVWLYRVNREMDGHEGFHIDLRWLAVLVALPFITPIVVKFQTARRMNQMVSHQVTVPLIRANRLGWISIIPVLGSGFFAWWVQSTLNKHWFHHRREERIQLAKDRIASIDQQAEADPALVEKRQHLAEEVARMEREVEEEVEAARIRWGAERFEDRMKRAKLHEERGGRMSRKELTKLREEEKRHRKEAKRRKKAERGRFFGLLPAKTTTAQGAPAGRDPDNDADWLPTTPPPPRTPDEIQALAATEGRELDEEETKELKSAEKLMARREKEAAKLEAQREKLRVRREKERAKAEAAAEKQRLKEEAAAEKERLKKEKEAEKATAKGEAKAAKKKAKPEKKEKKVKPAKGEKKAKKPKKGKKGKESDDDKIPVDVKPRTLRAPPTVHDAGEGPLRLLTVKCPRCRTEIQDIKKRGDAPAKITCPTCHLVGKI